MTKKTKLETGTRRRKLQLEGFDIVTSIMKSLVGRDENPSPFVRTIARMGAQHKAQIELAQDGVLLSLDIMDIFKDAALGKTQPWQVVGLITAVIFSAVPELSADVTAIKALEEILEAAEQEAKGRDSMDTLRMIKRNMFRKSRP